MKTLMDILDELKRGWGDTMKRNRERRAIERYEFLTGESWPHDWSKLFKDGE